ncbi:MAG TPA: protein kinase, partial [Polyangiaceae bacterium]
MDIDILRGEIERLFSLDELTTMSRDLLGLDPQEVGGTSTKASFVRALTDRCSQDDALDALVEAVIGLRADAGPKLRDLSQRGFFADEPLAAGAAVGPFSIQRRIGEGSIGIVYAAEQDAVAVALKVLRRESARDARALQRFLTVTRLIGKIASPALPAGLTVGHLGEIDAYFVSYESNDGESLATRVKRDGPIHIEQARPILREVLEALAALHEKGIAHGDLKLENVIVARGGNTPRVQVVDGGVDRLRLRARVQNGHSEVVHTLGGAKTIAPEQIRGGIAQPRSDVYAFGAMLYELLTGEPVFDHASPIDAAVAHLMEKPRPPSDSGPRGTISKELDRFVLSLLAKEPSSRPRDAKSALEAFDATVKGARPAKADVINESELSARVEAVLSEPDDEAAALRLESAVQEGADPERVARAFVNAAEHEREGIDAITDDDKKSLLFRAARVFEGINDRAAAEAVYTRILAVDEEDDIAHAALLQARKSLGKFEEVVEMLLARSDAAKTSEEKARALAEIGRIYASELEDREQALVAYAQAFCEDPETDDYAEELERLAGSDVAAWTEVTSICADTAQGDLPAERKAPLLARLGRWYAEKASRADLAVSCFQALLSTNPNHEIALGGLAQVYRKAQQWSDLAPLLVHRAGVAPSPSSARDYLAEAGELFETKLGDRRRARELYEQVIDDEPTHVSAGDGLSRILESEGDFLPLVRMLEARSEVLRGDKRWAAMARIAEIFEERLGDMQEATRRYEVILSEDEQNTAALKGLDRIYERSGRFRDLLTIIERQLRAAVTPRQRLSLYQRLATVYEEEFIDHEKAAEACEAMLAIDPNVDDALSALTRHYRALDRWEQVASTYERHLKTSIDDRRKVEILLALGKVLLDPIKSPARALAAYERVVALDERNDIALDSIAKLRAGAGDSAQALEALETLARQAKTPEARAEQWIRAAKLLEQNGDVDGAIQRYKLALDAVPSDATASDGLRAAFTARGDVNAAVELLRRRIALADGPSQKARLLSEVARLCKQELKDDERAEQAATEAHRLDPTDTDALVVLGDLAFEQERFAEAANFYELPANRAAGLAPADATRVLLRTIDALYQIGSAEKAPALTSQLLQIAPDDAAALASVARVSFDHGDPTRAYELYRELLNRFRDRLTESEESDSLYRLGEAARRAGFIEFAYAPLAEAADLDPQAPEPLEALAKLYETAGDWENVVKTKSRRLEFAEGDE